VVVALRAADHANKKIRKLSKIGLWFAFRAAFHR